MEREDAMREIVERLERSPENVIGFVLAFLRELDKPEELRT